jgi:hypothetical protein
MSEQRRSFGDGGVGETDARALEGDGGAAGPEPALAARLVGADTDLQRGDRTAETAPSERLDAGAATYGGETDRAGTAAAGGPVTSIGGEMAGSSADPGEPGADDGRPARG